MVFEDLGMMSFPGMSCERTKSAAETPSSAAAYGPERGFSAGGSASHMFIVSYSRELAG